MFDDVDFKTHQNPFVFMDFNVCMYVSNGELGIATSTLVKTKKWGSITY